jgi:hypothetical protein
MLRVLFRVVHKNAFNPLQIYDRRLVRRPLNLPFFLHRAKEKLRDGGAESLVASCIVCCFEAILSGIEFVTKFTIITVAITGDSFCTAAQQTFGLLRRNLLSSVTVDSVSVSAILEDARTIIFTVRSILLVISSTYQRTSGFLRRSLL